MKFKAITEDLRSRIVQGEFTPQTAIPTRSKLLKEYDTCNSALQRSINSLITEGFLESRGIKGVCVVANPPHLSHYALCFPTDSITNLHHDSLWNAIYASAAEITKESNETIFFKNYFIGKKQSPSESEWEQLFNDIESHLLAGAIILINERFKPPRFPADFPYVIYDYETEEQYEHGIRLATDHVKLFSMALGKLEKQGCERIAAIAPSNLNLPSVLQIHEHMASAAGYFPPEWLLPIDQQNGTNFLSAGVLNLLFGNNQTQKPDALIVMNESLLPLVIDTLAAKGVICGRDVQIVSHCNYPMSIPRQPQVSYIGFHAKDILQTALKRMREFNEGNKAVTSSAFSVSPIMIQ